MKKCFLKIIKVGINKSFIMGISIRELLEVIKEDLLFLKEK